MAKYMYEILVRFQPPSDDGLQRMGAHVEYRDSENPNFIEVMPLNTKDFPADDKRTIEELIGVDNAALLAQNADLASAVVQLQTKQPTLLDRLMFWR